MDDTVWFEEEIFPSDESVQMVAGSVKGLDAGLLEAAMEALGLGSLLASLAGMSRAQRDAAVTRRARETFRGIIRAHKPAAFPLAAGTRGRGGDALPYARGAAYLVRLGVEFDLPEELKEARYFYRKVYCRATLSAEGQECLPTVLEVYPDRLIEGEPRLVRVEFKPALKWTEVEGSLGSAATDVQVGVVAPATVGFLGDEQRAPYWEMTEKQQAILGDTWSEERGHIWGVRPRQAQRALSTLFCAAKVIDFSYALLSPRTERANDTRRALCPITPEIYRPHPI